MSYYCSSSVSSWGSLTFVYSVRRRTSVDGRCGVTSVSLWFLSRYYKDLTFLSLTLRPSLSSSDVPCSLLWWVSFSTTIIVFQYRNSNIETQLLETRCVLIPRHSVRQDSLTIRHLFTSVWLDLNSETMMVV